MPNILLNNFSLSIFPVNAELKISLIFSSYSTSFVYFSVSFIKLDMFSSSCCELNMLVSVARTVFEHILIIYKNIKIVLTMYFTLINHLFLLLKVIFFKTSRTKII